MHPESLARKTSHVSQEVQLPKVEEAHLLEYLALREKVDAQVSQITAGQPDAFACRPGCESCCLVSLTLSTVEAAAVVRGLEAEGASDDDYRASLRQRLASGHKTVEAESPRCVLLDGNGRCQLYASRPLVCRTQGLALRYPSDLVPLESVRATMNQTGEISQRRASPEPLGEGQDALVWCPLNYDGLAPSGTQEEIDTEKVAPKLPSPREVLDASRIDALSGLVNHRYCEQTKQERNQRWSLRQLVTSWLGAC